MSLTARLPQTAVSAVPALLTAALAWGISLIFPLAGPLLMALVIGAVVANSRLIHLPVLAGHASTTRLLLRLGVVILGLKLPLGDIVAFGPHGLVIVLATVVVTFTATVRIGDRLGLDRDFVTLLASGFSICGAAAIAAVDEGVEAEEKNVGLAVALVTIYGSAMIILVPWGSGLLGLTTTQGAIWAGASIHEVAQVVAAAALLGSGAVAVAMTIKLGRILLLAPTYLAAMRRNSGAAAGHVPLVPWFLIGFVIAAGVRTTGLLPDVVLSVSGVLTTLLLAAGMFGLGLGIRAEQLWPIPPRVLLLATVSTCVAAGVSLTLVVLLG